MCFSAGASFAGSIILSTIGVATLGKVRKPAQRLFALIPLLFGFQQLVEGILWLTLRSNKYDYLQNIAIYTFLITALVIWPTMIPLSMWFIEEVKRRKTILIVLILIGGTLTLFYGYCLIFYNVSARIQDFHIQYIDTFPVIPVRIAFVLYFIATIAPLFVSSVKRMWLFGVLITISCVITGIFFAQYLTSVWCFFAALISVVIYWILSGSQNKKSQLPAGTQTQ